MKSSFKNPHFEALHDCVFENYSNIIHDVKDSFLFPELEVYATFIKQKNIKYINTRHFFLKYKGGKGNFCLPVDFFGFVSF